ncbi:MAG TPA: DUF1835 domain-containing protein [Chitinophagaceae bacterium]|jgi:hypothetical protein
MNYHILNGDSLATTFPDAKLRGEIIVARECLIEGDLHGDSLDEFWNTRASYIGRTYHEQNRYYTEVVKEFEKIINAPDSSEFNLWFGYDLFCRANMWFVISLLYDLRIHKNIFVVYPSFLNGNDRWKEFGNATEDDLIVSYNNRIRFTDEDLKLGKDLWIAYKNNDLHRLSQLSKNESACFPYLYEVCEAHIDRFPSAGKKGRPERVIEDIVHNVSNDFATVFKEFFKREGIYGFGDVQIKQLYDKVIN